MPIKELLQNVKMAVLRKIINSGGMQNKGAWLLTIAICTFFFFLREQSEIVKILDRHILVF